MGLRWHGQVLQSLLGHYEDLGSKSQEAETEEGPCQRCFNRVPAAEWKVWQEMPKEPTGEAVAVMQGGGKGDAD